MKKTVVNVIAVVLLALISSGCSKNTTGNVNKSPFTQVFQSPCEIYDDEDYFAATGIAYGSAGQKGTLQKAALKNAQEMCELKLKHVADVMVSNYSEVIGRNSGTDIDAHTQDAIDHTISTIVNETTACCQRFSEVDDRGNVECYIAIKIPKQEVVDAVAENLSKSQKQEIRENSEKFRNIMRERVKEYNETR